MTSLTNGQTKVGVLFVLALLKAERFTFCSDQNSRDEFRPNHSRDCVKSAGEKNGNDQI